MPKEFEKTEDVKSRIEQAIDSTIETAKVDPEPAPSQEEAPATEPEEKTSEPEAKTPETKTKAAKETMPPSTVSDDAIERAIRAGMSISNARKYADDGALLEAVGILENMQHSAAENKGDDGDVSPSDAPLDDPAPIDLPDDDDISPSVRSYISRLEQSIRRHEATIKALSSEATASGDEWFSAQIDKLGAAYSKELGNGSSISQDQQAKRDKIRSTYEILAEGYKSRGMNESREEILKSAVRMVAGDGDPSRSRKQALTDRRGLETFRPSRVPARRESANDSDTIVAQVAAELREHIAQSTI